MPGTESRPTPSPDALYARFRERGDPAALAALFDATAEDLYRVALAVTADAATAEDALQETFLAAVECADRFDGTRPVVPWLVGVLRHKVAHLRRRDRRRPDPVRLRLPPLDGEGPAAEAERRERDARVHAALEALPESCRMVALLRWKHGLEPAEIAALLRTRPGTVRMTLSRALRRLREALGAAVLSLVPGGAREPRGREAIRSAVLERAAAAAPVVAGTGAVILGGALVAKKAAAVVVLGAILAWVCWPGVREEAPGRGRIPAPAPAATPGRGAETAALPEAVDPPAGATGGGEAPGTPAPGAAPEADPGPPPPADTRISGRILGPDRRPVTDATVTVQCSDGQVLEVRTGPDGVFRIPTVTVKGSGSLMQHFRATDGRGRWARSTLYQGVSVGEGEPVEFLLGGVGMGDLLLREASSLEVRVTAGGGAVEGARVWAVEETTFDPRTEDRITDGTGAAVLEHLPHGRWCVRAEAPGRGAGRRSVAIPGDGRVEVVLYRKSVEVEVVDAASGAPLEGVRLLIQRRRAGDPDSWWGGYPPIAAPPTDSSGRTRIEDVGLEDLRLRAVPRGLEDPPEGTPAVVVPERETAARLEVPAGRTIRFPLAEGDEGALPDGTAVAVVAPDELRMLVIEGMSGMVDARRGRVEGGALLLDWPGPGRVEGYGKAEDGRVARLRAEAGATGGEPATFRSTRTLSVRVVDEDGEPVTDSVVVVKDPGGFPLNLMGAPGSDGVSLFEGLPAATCWVCPLANFDWGGAAVARVDLTRGNREIEVVVGRSVPVVATVRVGGKPGLPPGYEIGIVRPLPEGAAGEAWTVARLETAHGTGEEPGTGTVRFAVRAHAPGMPISLELRVPGRDPVAAEARPDPAGGGATVAFDL